MEIFDPQNIKLTKYLFYTGKGGVGKTSTACATALTLDSKITNLCDEVYVCLIRYIY